MVRFCRIVRKSGIRQETRVLHREVAVPDPFIGSEMKVHGEARQGTACCGSAGHGVA